jgi:hypothetical protein
MAFIVPTKRGEFEIRESHSTPKGPRSRTLVTFRELDDEVIEKARAKAAKPPTAEELRRAARRVGATVSPEPVERAARALIAELGRGRRLDPTLRHLLMDLLQREGGNGSPPRPASDAARSVAEWMAATPEERGRTLFDLLLLADALPHGGRRGKPLLFPRLDSARNG